MVRPILYLNDAVAIGGGERNLLALLEVLDKSKWRPIVTCPRDGAFPSVLRGMGVQVEWVKLPDCRKLKEVFRGIFAWLCLNRIVRREQVAIIHANSPPWFPLGCIVAKQHRIPSVVSIQGRFPPRRIRQYLLHRADLVFAVADSLRLLVEAAGVPVGRTKTIYSTVDTERFVPCSDTEGVRKQFGIADGDLVIGCVANVAHYKGHDILIQAFAKLSQMISTAHLLLVGTYSSEYGAAMTRMAQDLGLARRVHFVGFQNDVRPYFGAIDMMVLPSRQEGAPVAILEAMAMAKPLIASAVDGTPEIVQDGITGILVPPEDPEAVVVAVADLIKDPKRLQVMGEAGRRRAELFSVRRAGKILVEGYESLLTSADETPR